MKIEHPAPDYALIDRAGAASFLFYPRPDPVPPPPGALDDEIAVEPGVVLGARFYGFERALPGRL